MRRKRLCREWLIEYLGNREVDTKVLRQDAEAAGYSSATLHSVRYDSEGLIVFRLNAKSPFFGSTWRLDEPTR